MNIDELTLGQIKQLKAMLGGSCAPTQSHSIKVGTKVIIRTVTMTYTGLVEAITDSDIVLSTAAWIADSRRWHDALRDGFEDSAEIEPYPDGCIVSRGAVVDVSPWVHELPTEQQ